MCAGPSTLAAETAVKVSKARAAEDKSNAGRAIVCDSPKWVRPSGAR